MLVQEGRNLFVVVPCGTVGTREVLCVCRKNVEGWTTTPIRGLSEACFWRFPNKLIPWNIKNVRTTHSAQKKVPPVSPETTICGQGIHRPGSPFCAWGGNSKPGSSCQWKTASMSCGLALSPCSTLDSQRASHSLVPSQVALKCHLNEQWCWELVLRHEFTFSPDCKPPEQSKLFPFPTKKKKKQKKQRS